MTILALLALLLGLLGLFALSAPTPATTPPATPMNARKHAVPGLQEWTVYLHRAVRPVFVDRSGREYLGEPVCVSEIPALLAGEWDSSSLRFVRADRTRAHFGTLAAVPRIQKPRKGAQNTWIPSNFYEAAEIAATTLKGAGAR